MHQDRLARRRPLCALLPVRLPRVQVTVYKIRNHLDGPLDVELSERLVQQITRYRSHAVTLLDGILGDRQIGPVAAHQGDIRSVQRGDEREPPGRRHRPRQQRAHGMGNGVVHVEQVERFGFEHLPHLRGQSQGIRRVVKQGVAGNLHFMEEDVRVAPIHSNRGSVADEMHVMPAGGQFLAELSGYDAGTAVGGVAGYTNAHSQVTAIWSQANTPAKPLPSKLRSPARMSDNTSSFESGTSARTRMTH